MKKLMSSILIVTMSFCSFGASACFADGTTPETQEVRAEQIVDQKVDFCGTPKDLKKVGEEIQQISKPAKSHSTPHTPKTNAVQESNDNHASNKRLETKREAAKKLGKAIGGLSGILLGAFAGFTFLGYVLCFAVGSSIGSELADSIIFFKNC
ncbi:MAG: hypothetical protein RUMPE_00056 [Eubacteriales bacterium SKADARSKE-1]|nr:hypothetical protein [Eubacteriales bacterium SKADARSKE-1]